MPTICDPCLTATVGIPQGTCAAGTLAPVFCLNGAPNVCIPSAAGLCPPVNTTLAGQGIPCADTRGAPVFCSVAGGSVLRTLPIPCMGIPLNAGNNGTFAGTPIPVNPGIVTPMLTIPSFTNTGCYDAWFSLVIRGTFTMVLPAGGNELRYQVELDGNPQRFGSIVSGSAQIAQNVYEELVYDTLFVVAGGVFPAMQLQWRFILAQGLAATITNWTLTAQTGAWRSMPDCP